jgi:catechol 2,3-dioxygenase-like lactoylglutathione lyase family enzyme
MTTETAPLVTGVDFVCLPVTDYDRSAAFYGETLGLPFVKRWGSMPAGEFQAGQLTLALMDPTAFGLEFSRNAAPVALQVDDVDEARTRLEAEGITFQVEKLDSGTCHQAIFSDPDGNPLILHHKYAR